MECCFFRRKIEINIEKKTIKIAIAGIIRMLPNTCSFLSIAFDEMYKKYSPVISKISEEAEVNILVIM
jgi:hypothetical protein